MSIADERPVWLGAMGALAQVVECQSAVLAQAAATLLPSARSYHPFCTPRPGKNVSTKFVRTKGGCGEDLNYGRYSVRTLIAPLEHS